MKALCTFFVLVILVAGGAIAFRTFAPEQWNALFGSATDNTPAAVQTEEETTDTAAVTPEDTAASPRVVDEKPSPAAKAKATDKSKPRTADRPAAKPVDHPANASGQIGWGVVASIKPTFYNKKGKRIETKFAPKAGTPFVVTKEIAADGEPAYVVIFDTHPNKPECVLLGSDCSIILTPPPDIAPDNADALVAYVKDRGTLRDYYAARGARDAYEQRARDKHYAASPAKDLPKLKAQLVKIPGQDREYEAAQKAAKTDSERLKYQDLRKELRYTATGLQANIRRLTAAKEEWEKDHPYDENAVKRSAVWRRLNQNVESLAPAAQAIEDRSN